MATVFLEGFDKYSNLLTAMDVWYNEWNSYTALAGTAGITTGLSDTGQAALLSINSFTTTAYTNYSLLTKKFPTNYSRFIGGFRFKTATLGPKFGITFLDDTVAKCNITFGGSVNVRPGEILSSPNDNTFGTIAINTIYYLEFDITMDTTFRISVWLNGTSLLTNQTITGAEAGTGSRNIINGFSLGGWNNNAAQVNFTVDDLYIFDNTTEFNNTRVGGNPQIITQTPTTTVTSTLTDTQPILYGFTPLNSSLTVLTTAVKIKAKASGAGTTSIAIHTKSNTTDKKSSAFQPGYLDGYYGSYFDLDPDTNQQWTTQAIDASTSGLGLEST